MQRFLEESVKCAVCGNETAQAVRTPAATSGGPPDFDTRPGEADRAAISSWIAECERCGYCADDVTMFRPGVDQIVHSQDYRECNREPSLPAVARRFLCYGFILEKLHQWADAGWTCLHAAWACDDAGGGEHAAACRAMAIDRWKRGKQMGQSFADDLPTEFALVTDLYRRIGAFEHATVACAEGLDIEDIPPAVEQMLRRQMVLIQRHDTACHSMSELQSKQAAIE
jgi:hypothetical protein